MNSKNNQIPFLGRFAWSGRQFLVIAAAGLALAGTAPAATIGVHPTTQANNGGTNGNLLAATDMAGAGIYAQVNWNNINGALGTNVALVDSSGAASGVSVSWAAPNTWSQTGNTSANQLNADANLMNPFLDNNGNANVAISGAYNMFSTATPVNNNRNWPLVYLTNMTAWLAAQGVPAYDVVIYSDGDATSGRAGEYWVVAASGPPTALTLGSDLTTHTWVCDRANFITTLAYVQVPATVSGPSTNSTANLGGYLSQRGNFQGNYTVFSSLTNDTVLFRTQRYNTRAPINNIQIIPRATLLPATIDPLPASPVVYTGAKAQLAAQVAGVQPLTYQWQRAGTNLIDAGNVSGSLTATLTLSNVAAADASSYSLVVTNPMGVVTSSVAALTVVAPAAGSFPEKIATNYPVAYWRFNENADPSTAYTAAYDYVGGFNGIYGTAAQNGFNSIAGPQPAGFPGFEGGNAAMQSGLNSAHSWVRVPPLNLNTNTVTITAWIYPTAAQGANAGILFNRNGTGIDVQGFGFSGNANTPNNLTYTWNGNGNTFNWTLESPNYNQPMVPLTNAWSFVALVVSPTNAIIYLNNASGQFSVTNIFNHTNGSWNALTLIGDDPSSTTTPENRAFTGAIDEVAVFNRCLPGTEILNLYRTGLQISTIPPVIVKQPLPSGLMEGRNATFSVIASGDAPLAYQWQRDGTNLSDIGNITGSATPALTVSSVSIANDAAGYDVVINNLAGSITSSVATLSIVVSNSTPTPYETKIRALNPLSYWRLNETNGSPYSYDYWGGIAGVNEGSITLGVNGPQPPDFSGMESTNTAASYVSIPGGDTATGVSMLNNRPAFSVIGWFKTAGTISNRKGLFGQNDVCEFGFLGNGTDGQAGLGFFTPRASVPLINQSTNVLPGVWYLIAAVASGTNVSVLLASTNGAGGIQVIQSSTSHAATTNYGFSADPFRIAGGGVIDTTDNYFDGVVDEVAVFGRGLSLDEISGLFGAALSGGDLPPTISLQPVSRTAYQGQTATFAVSALGTGPLKYQWRTNGVPLPNSGNVSGATNATLTITNLQGANSGNYDVVITNRAGSITSLVATLNVVVPTSVYESALIALNPLAYYRLNETNDPSSGSVVANDFWGGNNGLYGVASQNGFNGIQGPVPPDFSFEASNTALATFAGLAGSYATAPFGTLSTNTVTMCMWVNPTGAFDTFTGLLVNRNSGVAGGFGYTGGFLGYTWNNNSAATYNATYGNVSGRSDLIPPLNVWSFISLVVSPTNAIVSMANSNGLFSATNVLAHTSDVFGNLWRIGQDANDGVNATTRVFNGVIDEVAVFTYDLSAAQLQSLYLAGGGILPVTLTITPSGTNVVLSWPQGSLQQATNVLGPWVPNNATSPYTTPATNSQTFYRVRVR
jgi:hypothetical protein